MTPDAPHRGRRLESESSQAARTPIAAHDDMLSPVEALRESINASGTERLGDSPPVGNPIGVYPDVVKESGGQHAERDVPTVPRASSRSEAA